MSEADKAIAGLFCFLQSLGLVVLDWRWLSSFSSVMAADPGSQLAPLDKVRPPTRHPQLALISANRRAGAQQGLVTKAKNKIAQLEAEMTRLEQERNDLLVYRQRVEE